jgi:hypothetical protein
VRWPEVRDRAVYDAIAAVGTRADGGPLRLLAAEAIRQLAETEWAFDARRFPSAFRDDDDPDE